MDTRTQHSVDRSTRLRACSFNIRYDTPEDEHPWEERVDRVTSAINDIDPGLLGVQEALSHQYDDLRRNAEDYEWYGVGRADGDRDGEMVPVAWRADRFTATETGEFWLSETPDQPSVGWDGDFPRVTTWVSLRHRETGRRIWLCNTHLSHVGETARVESARLLRERAETRVKDGEDIVITGDFNSKPSRKPYQIMTGTANNTDSPLFDPRREADTDTVNGPWGTYHGFTDESNGRIDYVFTLDTATIDWYRTLTVREEGYRSDHLPIASEFEYTSPDEPRD